MYTIFLYLCLSLSALSMSDSDGKAAITLVQSPVVLVSVECSPVVQSHFKKLTFLIFLNFSNILEEKHCSFYLSSFALTPKLFSFLLFYSFLSLQRKTRQHPQPQPSGLNLRHSVLLV